MFKCHILKNNMSSYLPQMCSCVGCLTALWPDHLPTNLSPGGPLSLQSLAPTLIKHTWAS